VAAKRVWAGVVGVLKAPAAWLARFSLMRRLAPFVYAAIGAFASFIINRLAADCPIHATASARCRITEDWVDLCLLLSAIVVGVEVGIAQEMQRKRLENDAEVSVLDDFVTSMKTRMLTYVDKGNAENVISSAKIIAQLEQLKRGR